jgi:hypothetical protein
MNLTSLLVHENLGVSPAGVVDVEVELNWQSVVTFVISSANENSKRDNVVALLLLDVAVRSVRVYCLGRMQSPPDSASITASTGGSYARALRPDAIARGATAKHERPKRILRVAGCATVGLKV